MTPRVALAAVAALALALGAMPSARAADGGGAVAPERLSIDQTIERLTAKTRRERQDRLAWAALGDAFMQKARETADLSYYGRAEQAFEQARTLDGGRPDALVGLAWVQSARHEFEQSTEWAQKALATDPTSAAAYGLLGDAALELGEYDLAAEHYQKMLDLRRTSRPTAAALTFCSSSATCGGPPGSWTGQSRPGHPTPRTPPGAGRSWP